MKKILNKILVCAFVAGMILTAGFSTSAAGKGDYEALKYVTSVTDKGNNTVSISGKGAFSVKVGGNVNDAMAVIFKDTIDPLNFETTLTFEKDYGNGSGKEAGWYSLNLSRTPNWFSSVKTVISSNKVQGVNLTFKIDSTNKKKVYVQPARYSPGSGFLYLLDATEFTLKKDWECNIKVEGGKLYIDGTFFTDLSDAIALAMPEKKAFLGFGGFSEEFNDVQMSIKYDGVATRNDYASYGKTEPVNPGTGTSSSKPTVSSQPGNTQSSSTPAADNSSSSSQVGNGDSSDSASASDISNSTDVSSETDISSDTESEISSESNMANSDASEESGSTVWIIVAVIIVVLAGATAAVLIIVKKRKSEASEK